MKLSEGTTTAARDVACGMRSTLLFLHLASPFFPPALSVPFPVEEPELSRFLRDIVPFLFDGITLRALSVTCGCVRRAGSKSPTITRDSTEMEYVRISDFHGFPLSPFLPTFPPLPPALFDFPRESAARFDFSPMFVFVWIIQPLVPYFTHYFLFRFVEPLFARKQRGMPCAVLFVVFFFSMTIFQRMYFIFRIVSNSLVEYGLYSMFLALINIFFFFSGANTFYHDNNNSSFDKCVSKVTTWDIRGSIFLTHVFPCFQTLEKKTRLRQSSIRRHSYFSVQRFISLKIVTYYNSDSFLTRELRKCQLEINR